MVLISEKSSNVSIRIIHHWACSGGTIISRSIANLQDVVLLSEVHPLAYLRLAKPKPSYTPTDIIQQLCLPHNNSDPVLCVAAWRGAITELARKMVETNKVLVLRNHSHIDFFTGAQPETEHFITRILKDIHVIDALLTVRHPLDSWISIKCQNWDRHFRFSTFNEFCNRANLLVEASEGLPVIRYEEFTINPKERLESICRILKIKPETTQPSALDAVTLSGDSGRRSNKIQPRRRRPIPEAVEAEIQAMDKHRDGSAYLRLCSKLGYNPDPIAKHPFLSTTYQPARSSATLDDIIP